MMSRSINCAVGPRRKPASVPAFVQTLVVLAMLAVLGAPSLAQARYLTPQTLYDDLNSGNIEKYNRAYGYVLGVYDSFEGVIFRPRVDLKADKLVEVVDRYMKEHMEEENYSAQLLVLRALEAYAKQLAAEKKEP